MPPVIRLYVKTSIVFFVLTFVSGALFLLWNAIYLQAMPRDLVLLHAHMGFVGWLGLMVMGVAWWMFPLDRTAHPETKGRYHLPTAYAVYYLTVGGLALRIVGEPLLWRTGHPFASFLLIVSAVAQLAAVTLFAAGIWNRVRPVTGSV